MQHTTLFVCLLALPTLQQIEGNLEIEKSKKLLGLLFEKIDTSGNGQIDKSELNAWLETHFQNTDREEAKPEFEKLDTNEDGYVSFDEYVTNTYGYSLDELNKMREDPSTDAHAFLESIDEAQVKFVSADENNDDLLELLEFTAFQNPYYHPRMISHTIKDTVRFMDKDGDGKLSENEYISEDMMIGEGVDEELKRFKEIDKNSDGFIDRDELGLHLQKQLKDHSTTEVENLILQTDLNNDGVLTKAEVTERHDSWLQSQVTDYGELLKSSKYLHDEL